MLCLVGLGLKAKDLTLEGLDVLNSSQHIYYEDYTSVIDWISELEAIVGKKFKRLQRSDMEEGSKKLIDLSAFTDIVILVSGDPLAATTHHALLTEAKKRGVETKVVHAPSVLTAIGETGLWLYKFGRVVTLPKQGKIDSVKEFIKNNQKIGLHTLVLLDIGMTCQEGVIRMLEEKIITENQPLIACSRLGRPDATITKKMARELKTERIEGHPQCLVLPGKINEMERF
jgi:diphthine synthase